MSICRDNILSGISIRRSRRSVVLIGSLILASCTTVTTQSFRATGSPNIDAGYIATDADFDKYHQLLADDMGIFFPKNSQLSDDEIRRIRQIFRDSFLAELTGYDIVNDAGPGTLKVQASLIDLRNASTSELPGMRADLSSIARPGALLFLMELRDSETDRVLGRVADSAATPSLAGQGGTDWDGIEAAAQHWAALFRGFLDENLHK